jgi:SAM-dependent methyltransferase
MLVETSRADGHVMEGTLDCRACRVSWPIRRGVPRLVPGRATAESIETAGRFGEQWKTFDHMSSYQEAWLKAWLDPVGPDDVRDKVVLEGGCGKGRHTVVVAGWGAKHVIALDLGEAVDVAFEHTRSLENVTVVQGDLLHPPVGRVFDVAFSIGVLHHLPDPRAGFESLVSRVRSGGRVAIWVYGRESNEWIVRFVNPIREKITARMPSRLLYWLSLGPSAALAAGTKLYRSRSLRDRLPYGAYLTQLSTLPVREVHNIVFDQLVTPIAHYLPGEEVRSWFAGDRFSDVTVSWHNRNSWRASAIVA